MSFCRKNNGGVQLEEDAASAVTVVEGRKKHSAVSFMDWANESGAKRKSLDLERMGSGVSCGDEYAKRFSKNGFGKTPNGQWVEQMQIYQRQDAARVYDMAALVNHEETIKYLHHPFQETFKYRYVEEVQGKRISPIGSFGVEGREEDTGGVDNKESPSPGEDKSRRVHMFDKAVTPSDVGKLNRLVIPKHHAEKFFPLDTNEKDKGLLLSFQDSAGKEWRFRYSYWSSSQSYVLTKGWSRFVREMKLHAGDVVSFHRAADAQNLQHFYISWKRRASKAPPLFAPFQNTPFQSHARTAKSPPRPPPQWMSFASAMPTTAPLWAEHLNVRLPTEAAQAMTLDKRNWVREPPLFMKLKPAEQPPLDSSYSAENAGARDCKKRVRLFGVNL